MIHVPSSFVRPFVVAAPVALAAILTAAPARPAAAQTPAPASSPAPAAPETAPRPRPQAAPQTPEERIEALDQQLRILARQIEIEKEAATAAQATAPVAVAGASGFELRSADSAFRLRIRGYLHADSRYYGGDDDNRGIDTFLLRRARPIVEATFFKIFDFRIMTDFGGGTAVVQDAYLDARFAKVFNLRAGKQKPPLGQERLASATDILFIERALPTALVPNRDVGVQVYGDLAPWLTYQVGVFNGVIDGGSGDVDTADSKDVVGRLLFSPFKTGSHERLQSLCIGIGGSGGKEVGTVAAPALAQLRSGGQLVWFRYRTDGTVPNTTVADGSRTRFTTHGQVLSGPARAAGGVRRVTTGGPPRHDRRRDRAAVLAADRVVGADRRDGDRPGDRPAQALRAGQGRLGRVRNRRPRQRADRRRCRVPGVRQPRCLGAEGDRRRRRPQLVSEPQREDRRRLRADALRARRPRRGRPARRARAVHAVPGCLLVLPVDIGPFSSGHRPGKV